MNEYWLDSDILIQAKNTYYAFDIAPGAIFWAILEKGAASGLIRSPMMVHEEIMRGGDQLTDWAKAMRSNGLFVDASQAIQKQIGII